MLPIAKTLDEFLRLLQQGNKRILCVEFALDLRNEREKVCTTEDEAHAFFAVHPDDEQIYKSLSAKEKKLYDKQVADLKIGVVQEHMAVVNAEWCAGFRRIYQMWLKAHPTAKPMFEFRIDQIEHGSVSITDAMEFGYLGVNMSAILAMQDCGVHVKDAPEPTLFMLHQAFTKTDLQAEMMQATLRDPRKHPYQGDVVERPSGVGVLRRTVLAACYEKKQVAYKIKSGSMRACSLETWRVWCHKASVVKNG